MKIVVLAMTVVWALAQAVAGGTMIENFAMQPEARWHFFSDNVMGGVSTGQVSFANENGAAFAHMTGKVSTVNNGGFIQMRMDLPSPPADAVTGVRLVVRGNDQRYFVHLRTGGTILPWQYYQAGFEVTQDWAEVRLPFTDFVASGRLLRTVPRASSLKSIGIVAFGRDHQAEIDVKEVGFY